MTAPRRPPLQVAKALVEITRPLNCVLAASGVVVAILVARLVTPVPARAWLAPLAAALIAAFGNVVNDLGDIAVDRITHPGRPLPSGRLGARHANLLAGWLAGTGLVCAGLAAGPATLVVALATLAILMLYELRLKRTGLAGNLAVAFATALTFPFGWIAVTGAWPAIPPDPEAWLYTIDGAVLGLAVMASFATVARELAKDAEDVAGDRGHRQTLPMTSPRLAATLAMGCAALAALASVALAPVFFHGLASNEAPALLGRAGLAVAAAGILVADLLVLGGGVLVARRPGRSQRTIKAGMALTLAIVAGVALVVGPR